MVKTYFRGSRESKPYSWIPGAKLKTMHERGEDSTPQWSEVEVEDDSSIVTWKKKKKKKQNFDIFSIENA